MFFGYLFCVANPEQFKRDFESYFSNEVPTPDGYIKTTGIQGVAGNTEYYHLVQEGTDRFDLPREIEQAPGFVLVSEDSAVKKSDLLTRFVLEASAHAENQ